jgi:hypothetical protein
MAGKSPDPEIVEGSDFSGKNGWDFPRAWDDWASYYPSLLSAATGTERTNRIRSIVGAAISRMPEDVRADLVVHGCTGLDNASLSTPKQPVTVADVEESVAKAMTPMQREQRRNAGRSSAARRTKGVGGNGSKKKSGPPQATKKRRGDRKVVVSERKAKRLMDTARKRGLKIDSRGAEGRADIVLPSGRRIKVMVK